MSNLVCLSPLSHLKFLLPEFFLFKSPLSPKKKLNLSSPLSLKLFTTNHKTTGKLTGTHKPSSTGPKTWANTREGRIKHQVKCREWKFRN
ncbi:hypothetical protein HanRHA438_Chr08g0360891 [Helianthus annuus]|nr:hypothetical protein HanRHA438_Chr08g0360891 [Helianthus annuus]